MREDITSLNWIIADLARTKKAVVIMGCSYAVGKGAYDSELVEECRPKRLEHWGECNYQGHDFSLTELEYYASKYDLDIWDGMLMTHNMEKQNSFGHQLCAKYLNSEYTPVIIGGEGKGNYSNVDKLNWLPIAWEKLDDIKVIWSITDVVRTDFFSGGIWDGQGQRVFPEDTQAHYKTRWPFDHEDTDQFSKEYNRMIREDDPQHDPTLTNYLATNFLRLLSNVHNWCKAHNAEFLMFDAFTESYNPKSLTYMFPNSMADSELLQNFIYNLPWESKIKLNMNKTFFDLAMSNETTYDYMLEDKHNMWEFVEIPEEDITCEWLMPCGHPSAKAHDLLAQILSEKITT